MELSNKYLRTSGKEENNGLYSEKYWNELYEEVYPMVLSWVLENKGPYDWAKEICHDAFVIYFRKQHTPGFVLTCKPSTFIVAIAKKVFMNRIRREKSHQKYFHPSGDEIFSDKEFPDLERILEENNEYEMNLNKMKKGLEKLGEPCRELLLDFYVRNLSMQELSEKFGYTNADNAKNQKYKCLQRLKKFFFNS